MKKVISLLVIFSIVLAMSITAFAVPTIDYVFGGTEEDGNYYYYMFGKNDTASEDVGITIEGKDKLFNLDAEALDKAKSTGLFGIGIADPQNILGDSFKVTPYQVVSGAKEEGAQQDVVKEEVIDSDETVVNKVVLTSLSVKNADGEELISDFDADLATYYVPVSSLTDELTIEAQADYTVTTTKEDANNQYVITVAGDKETNTYYVKYRVPVTKEVTYNSLDIVDPKNFLDGNATFIDTKNGFWFGKTTTALRLRPEVDSYIAYTVNENTNIKLVSAKLSESPARGMAASDETAQNTIVGNTIFIYQNVKTFNEIYDLGNSEFKDLSSLSLVGDDEAVLLNSYTCTTSDWVRTPTIANSTGNNSYYAGKVHEMNLDVTKMQVYDENVIILYTKVLKAYKNSAGDWSMYYVPPVLTVEYIVCD